MTGRHRDPACDESILDATRALLRQEGYRGLTVAAVIERSGVSSATLYRRWPTKQALVVAAMRTEGFGAESPDTGSLQGDLEAVVRAIAHGIGARGDLSAVLWTELTHNEELRALNRRAFVEPRLEQVRQIVGRAVARGELSRRPAAEVVLSLLTGPLYHRAFTLDEKLTPSFLRVVVRGVIGSLEP